MDIFGHAKAGFKKGVQADDSTALRIPIEQLRDLYLGDLKTAFTAIRDWFKRAGAEDNAVFMNVALDRVRGAGKSLSTILAGNADDTRVNNAFAYIGGVEKDLNSIMGLAKKDHKFADYLGKLSTTKDFNVGQYLAIHESFRDVLKTNNVGEKNFVEKIQSVVPKSVTDLGKFGLSQMAIGILGPAAIPLGFLGKSLMGLGGGRKQERSKAVRSRASFASLINSDVRKADYYESLGKTGTGIDKVYGNSLFGNKPQRTEQEKTEGPIRQGSQRITGGSGVGKGDQSMLGTMIYFWHKEAYKTKYLKDLMDILKKGAVGPVLGAEARAAGPALAIGGAALAGWMAGKWLLKKFPQIDKAVEAVFTHIFIGWDKLVAGTKVVFSKIGRGISSASKVIASVFTGTKVVFSKIGRGISSASKVIASVFTGTVKNIKSFGLMIFNKGKEFFENIHAVITGAWDRITDFFVKPQIKEIKRKDMIESGIKELSKLDMKKDQAIALAMTQYSSQMGAMQKATTLPAYTTPTASRKVLNRADDPFVDNLNQGNVSTRD